MGVRKALEGTYKAAWRVRQGAKVLEAVGEKLFWAGFVISGYEYMTGEKSGAEAGVDILVAGVGTWGMVIAGYIAVAIEAIGLGVMSATAVATVGWILIAGAAIYGAYSFYKSKQ